MFKKKKPLGFSIDNANQHQHGNIQTVGFVLNIVKNAGTQAERWKICWIWMDSGKMRSIYRCTREESLLCDE